MYTNAITGREWEDRHVWTTQQHERLMEAEEDGVASEYSMCGQEVARVSHLNGDRLVHAGRIEANARLFLARDDVCHDCRTAFEEETGVEAGPPKGTPNLQLLTDLGGGSAGIEERAHKVHLYGPEQDHFDADGKCNLQQRARALCGGVPDDSPGTTGGVQMEARLETSTCQQDTLLEWLQEWGHALCIGCLARAVQDHGWPEHGYEQPLPEDDGGGSGHEASMAGRLAGRTGGHVQPPQGEQFVITDTDIVWDASQEAIEEAAREMERRLRDRGPSRRT